MYHINWERKSGCAACKGKDMKKITIVGAGSTGHALAALLSMKGHEIYLTDSSAYADVLEKSARYGTIKLRGTVTGEGTPACITTNVAEALGRAELIICCTVSNRDEEVARMIAPFVTLEKPVLISAGNCGSLIYHRVFQSYGKPDILVGEVGGNFFPCRLSEDRIATIGLPLSPKAIAAFPPENTERLADAFSQVWEFTPVKSILYAAFNGPNLICHIAGTILNIAAIENSNGSFNLFKDGISPGVINLLEQIWEEKKAVFDVFGFTPAPPVRGMFEGIQNHDPFYDYFCEMDGPGSLLHRYVSEDAPLLACFFISIARRAGVEVPLYESMIRLLSAVTGTDYYGDGRTLENLSLGNLTREELITYFCET